MIKCISVITSLERSDIIFDGKQKIIIDLLKLNIANYDSFDIEIIFTVPISQVRNHDYTWKDCDTIFIANEFSPKILKLANGQIVQANIASGIWEITHDSPKVLIWRFNPELACPIIDYIGDENRKTISRAKQKINLIKNPALLFPKEEAIELSRSKIPFKAIACFTDHCDFDTAENLVIQRAFFKDHGIKVTKGFFLNHYSKRVDNASYQNHKDELLNWHNDGHELCYHSLSQSIKPDIESFDDFKQFTPPISDIRVWIDHGYQPYNFSLFKKNCVNEEDYSANFARKKINVLWNYVDSGTATLGVINQFNTQHFTLSKFLHGNSDLGLIEKMQLFIKNTFFHYFNNENMILRYKNAASNFKKFIFQKKFKSFLPLCKDFYKLSVSFLFIFLFWKTNKNKPYKLAKYTPVLFKHCIANNEFYIFQTLEMLDFKKSLCIDNIDLLIEESGVFIAHTYFSVPLEYHRGKLFSQANVIDATVSNNFKYLGVKIMDREIWNPTLSELIEYWSKFEKVILDVDVDGNVFEIDDSGLQIRKVI